jgi:anti-sigma B factor antagonist
VPTEEFAVTVAESGPDRTIVKVDGELDLGTAPKLAEELESATSGGNRVVLDLTGCDFIDSSGLRTLLSARAASETGGGSLAIVVADPNLLRVFEVASLDQVLEIHSTVDAALV